MKAYLKNYRQAPRKVRLVADAVRGKRVDEALLTLRFLPRKAAAPLAKLIASAFANAREQNASLSPREMFLARITVDKGATYFRWRARARGRASRIAKESSHVSVVLAPLPVKGAAEGKHAAAMQKGEKEAEAAPSSPSTPAASGQAEKKRAAKKTAAPIA